VLNAILTTSAGKTVSGGAVDGEESEESQKSEVGSKKDR
jgi:hypothetical protein